MGTAENADPAKVQANIDACAALAELLAKSGLKADRDFAWRPIKGGEHNEQSWADRFDEILIFLYGKS
jgi:hypothetical protein